DRLHRETQRTFGAYELATAYTPAGQLLSQAVSNPQLNREYGYDDSGQLIRIRGTYQEMYHYDDAGRLISARHHNQLQRYLTDPAGNRAADREQYPSLPALWRDNRISEDGQFFYRYDEHGRLTEKDERSIRDGGSHSHHYHYDTRHRLVHYRREQQGVALQESRYLYDPPGRRVGKQVWTAEKGHSPEVTWYGWDGDRLTTTQTDAQRIQTIYMPGSFTPLVRVETRCAELAKAARRTLAEKFQQEANVTFPPELVAMVDNLEAELQRGELSDANRAWLAQCGLTPEQIQNQMEPEYTPLRKIHLYHCDHRGLPLALVSHEGATEWEAEYDAWGNMLRETNPHDLAQLIRLPGQQYDEETGLYYNRHRYYDPQQGRYITQDPIGLEGGWNPYLYPLNPVQETDPLGLETLKCIKPLHSLGGTGEKSGPDIWGNPLYHQYLCVPDGKGGYICGGQDQRGETGTDGLWGPGKASNDTKEGSGRCDSVEKDNDCIENCLKEKFKGPRPRYTVLPDGIFPIKLGLFKNCQDWAEDTLKSCQMKCSGNDVKRLIRFMLTGVI
ncbi:UNVERIFIED_CONTAM: RHS domain-containing protein, partial [Enterobacter cloacae]